MMLSLWNDETNFYKSSSSHVGLENRVSYIPLTVEILKC
jgi:hypothetical protein